MRSSIGLLAGVGPVLLCLAGCTPKVEEALGTLSMALVVLSLSGIALIFLAELSLVLLLSWAVWRRQPLGLVWLGLSYVVLGWHAMQFVQAVPTEHARPMQPLNRAFWLMLAPLAFAALAATLARFTQRRWLSLGGSFLVSVVLGLGIATLLRPVEPVLVKVSGAPTTLALGPKQALCLLTTAGEVSCHDGLHGWSKMADLHGVSALYGGPECHCALGSGQVHCWGLGRAEPTRLEGIRDAVEVVPGQHSLWLRMVSGELTRFGDEHNLDIRPELGPLPASTQQLVGGSRFWCWRDGTQRVACQALDVRLPSLPGALALAATEQQVCAILPNHEVLCYVPLEAWSATRFPPAHCPSKDDDPSCGEPVRVPNLRDAVQLTAGYKHLCARTQTGEVYCWEKLDAVERIPLPAQARFVQASERRSCALLEDLRVFCWHSEHGVPVSEVLPSAKSAVLP